MHLRNRLFLVVGLILGLVGILLTLVWSLELGIVTLLVLNLLLLMLLSLQRRQLARVQQRMLTLMKSDKDKATVPNVENLDATKIRQDLKITNKKVIGLLQAQQRNLDLMNVKMEDMLKDKKSG